MHDLDDHGKFLTYWGKILCYDVVNIRQVAGTYITGYTAVILGY